MEKNLFLHDREPETAFRYLKLKGVEYEDVCAHKLGVPIDKVNRGKPFSLTAGCAQRYCRNVSYSVITKITCPTTKLSNYITGGISL